ncbi:MAG: hypothetical protein K1X79_02585 [Oligoflexia bacterium]|nr:hypothetical protein [Oligoflexia bacterium]
MGARTKHKLKTVKSPGVKREVRRKSQPQPQRMGASIWSAQVAELVGRDFASTEAAIAAVCSGVLDRLGVQGQERAEQEKFMLDLIETDPELRGVLLQSLRVRKR